MKRMERKWPEELEEFCEKEKDWLNDYALFMALKEKFQGDPWSRWPRPLRVREEEAVLRARENWRMRSVSGRESSSCFSDSGRR